MVAASGADTIQLITVARFAIVNRLLLYCSKVANAKMGYLKQDGSVPCYCFVTVCVLLYVGDRLKIVCVV